MINREILQHLQLSAMRDCPVLQQIPVVSALKYSDTLTEVLVYKLSGFDEERGG